MGLKKMKLINSNRINKSLILILFIVFLIKSFNGYLRWDLNQHIGMVDNFILNGDFYPTDEYLYSPVSIYPLGVRLIALAYHNIGLDDTLIDIMLLTSSLILIFTFILLVKYSYDRVKINKSIVPICITFTLICCEEFIFYSTEFKADTISLLLCFSGLILYLKNKKLILISSILIGSSVLFKQHSIGFLIGLGLYSILFYKHSIKYLSILSSLIYFLLFFYIYSDNQIKLYSFDVVSDDGIKHLSSILKDIYYTLQNILVFLVFFWCSVDSKINFKEIKKTFIELYENPYTYIFISIFGISFLGSIINGGNQGNIQVGLFFMLPILVFIFQKLKINYLKSIVICCISFFMFLPKLRQPINSLFERYQLIEIINNLNNNNKIKNALTSSNTYSVVRDLRLNGALIHDHYTPVLLDKNFDLNKLDWECYDLVITDKNEFNVIEESKVHGFIKLDETNHFIILIPKKNG